MDTLRALIVSGRIADLVLLVVALELVALAWFGARGRGPGLRALLPTLLAGAALALALRAALSGAAWPWMAAWLSAAGVAHAVDLRARWRRTG
jgi:hypothetical protein